MNVSTSAVPEVFLHPFDRGFVLTLEGRAHRVVSLGEALGAVVAVYEGRFPRRRILVRSRAAPRVLHHMWRLGTADARFTPPPTTSQAPGPARAGRPWRQFGPHGRHVPPPVWDFTIQPAHIPRADPGTRR